AVVANRGGNFLGLAPLFLLAVSTALGHDGRRERGGGRPGRCNLGARSEEVGVMNAVTSVTPVVGVFPVVLVAIVFFVILLAAIVNGRLWSAIVGMLGLLLVVGA